MTRTIKPRSNSDGHQSIFPRTAVLVEMQQPADDLFSVLRRRARKQPHQQAFIYLLDGQTTEVVLTYAELDQRARAIAAQLQDMGLVGQRVLLAFPHGLDFIAAFFGCMYAGCTAVPTYLPHRRTLDHFRAIAVDASAQLVLSTASAIAQHQALSALGNGSVDAASPVPWLAVDEISDRSAERWKMPVITPQTLAMLQYTSGSTSQPKGVMLSHANLIHNTNAIYNAFGMSRETSVFWLPPYHDMGLIGGVLEPILAGITSVLMAPASFLQRPTDWLTAISKYKATISGGPNFSYDLCVRKVTNEQVAALDLSSWSLAFVGAEPIQPETLERFAAKFAPCGFDPAAFYSCYGLAEATLMVSGAQRGSGPTVHAFDDTALEKNAVQAAPKDAKNVSNVSKARRLVSCGSPVGDLRVEIVDAKTRKQVRAAQVGEIWVAGGSVGQGYWDNPEQTRESFNAHLAVR